MREGRGRAHFRVVFCFVLGLAGVLAGRPALGGAEDPLKLARQTLDIANYEDALRYLNRALADDPDKEGIRALKGYAFYRLGQPDQALGELAKERERFPRNEDGWTLAAVVLLNKGEDDAAEALCRGYASAFEKDIKKRLASSSIARNIKAAPNAGIPSFVRGLVAEARGRGDDAEREFRDALKLGYDSTACRVRSAALALKAGDFGKAMRRVTETRDPAAKEAPEIMTVAALASRELGHTEEAMSLLGAALDAAPFEDWALWNFALGLVEAGRYGEAQAHLSMMLRLYPAAFKARELLDLSMKRKDPVKGSNLSEYEWEFKHLSVPIYRYSFYQDPESLAIRVNYGSMDLIRAGETDAAIGFLERFLKQYFLSPTLEYNLAQLYNARNARLECLRHASKAISMQPDFRDAWDLAANALFKAGEYGGASHFYARAVSLDPNDPEARYNLGCAQYAAGDISAAEESLRMAISIESTMSVPNTGNALPVDKSNPLKVDVQVRVHPVSVPAYLNLAKLYTSTNRGEQAIDCLVLALLLAPQTADAHFELGKLRSERGELKAAAEWFKKYLELGGDEAKVRPYLKKKRPQM